MKNKKSKSQKLSDKISLENSKWEDPETSISDVFKNMESILKESSPKLSDKYLKTSHGLIQL